MKKITIYICIFTICTLFIGCGKSNTSQEITELKPLPKENTVDLFNQFLAGEISADCNGLRGDDSFYISDLQMEEDEWDSYHIGDKIDLDNDGEKELILEGPYGGMYLDCSNRKIKVFAMGEGTADNLSYTVYNNEMWILHYDVTHVGRLWYRLDKYSGADTIVETITLHLLEENDNVQYYHNDTEISETEFNELRKKMGIG